MITKDQIKAARAMLGLKQLDLAKKAKVSLSTLNNIERGADADPRVSTLQKIRSALEKDGIVFTNESNSQQGLYLNQKPKRK